MSLLLLFPQAVSGSGINGTADITLGAVTASSAATLDIKASAAITLGAIASSSASTLALRGTAAITLGAITTTSAAALQIVASAPVTLGAVTAAAQATLQIKGTADITLGAIGVSSATKLALAAQASITLGEITAASTGVVGSAPITGTADITLGAVSLSATATIADPEPYRPSGFGGWASPAIQKVGDTRWDGIRRAREEARAAFDEVPATTPAKRKEAAVRAAEAVAKVAKTVRPVQAQRPAGPDGWEALLGDLQQLQAYLQGLIEQDRRIRAEQAREAAERWAIIERELALEAQREEELMIVFALVA